MRQWECAELRISLTPELSKAPGIQGYRLLREVGDGEGGGVRTKSPSRTFIVAEAPKTLPPSVFSILLQGPNRPLA